MSTQLGVQVNAEVTVDVPPETAFKVFTENIASWWPKSHTTCPTGLASVTLEARKGGRWFQLGIGGEES